MSKELYVNLVVEDAPSEAVLRVMLKQVVPHVEVSAVYGMKGNGFLRKNCNAFNQASKGMPYLLLTDLDHYPCPRALIADWKCTPFNEGMLFRIAIKEIESWIMSMKEPFSDFLGVAKNKIPDKPDTVSDPKQLLLNLARRSRSNRIAKEMVPERSSTAAVGPGYNSLLTAFVYHKWIAIEAAKNSESLSRCIDRVKSRWSMRQ